MAPPPDAIVFMHALRMRIAENLVYRPIGYEGTDPQVRISGNSIPDTERSVKAHGLLDGDAIDHIGPRRGVRGKSLEVPESGIIGCPTVVLRGKADPVCHFIQSGKEEPSVINNESVIFSRVTAYCRGRIGMTRRHQKFKAACNSGYLDLTPVPEHHQHLLYRSTSSRYTARVFSETISQVNCSVTRILPFFPIMTARSGCLRISRTYAAIS